MFILTVSGGREFIDYDLFCREMDEYLSLLLWVSKSDELMIYSGEQRGADKMAKRYANERGHRYLGWPANWDKYGICAGPIRNAIMASKSDAVICFWNEESKGTGNMIKICEDLTIYPKVCKVKY